MVNRTAPDRVEGSPRARLDEATKHAKRAIELAESAVDPVPPILDSWAKIARRLGFISKNTLRRRIEAAYVNGVCVAKNDPLLRIIRYEPVTRSVWAYVHDLDSLRNNSPALVDLGDVPAVKSSDNLREMHARRRAAAKPAARKRGRAS